MLKVKSKSLCEHGITKICFLEGVANKFSKLRRNVPNQTVPDDVVAEAENFQISAWRQVV
jgi:hypothetical protein